MIKNRKKTGCILVLTICYTLLVLPVFGQDRTQVIENKLTALANDIPELTAKTDISVNDVSIQDFVAGLASSVDLNMHIDPTVKQRITGNYKNVAVADILLFLCKEYKLDIRNTGNIISLVPYIEPVPVKKEKIKQEMVVAYNTHSDLLTIDLQNDTLHQVARKIIDATGKNMIVSPALGNKVVSGYIKNMEFDNALEKLLYANGLVYSKTRDNFYLIEELEIEKTSQDAVSGRRNSKRNNSKPDPVKGELEIIFHSPPNFSVRCTNYPLQELVEIISDTLNINYMIVDELEGTADINLSNIEYNQLLNNLFIKGGYGHVEQNGYCLIGRSDNHLIQTSKLVTLRHRTVDGLMDFIPPDIIGNLTINEFTEQNGFIVVGNPIYIERFEQFMAQIDQVVPLILIEILIVEVNKNVKMNTGISAGTGNSPESSQTILPGVDYSLSVNTLNSVLNTINGLGWVNLGAVSPNFYLHIQALEENGKITIQSTPKLSTLNGHEATLSSGETKYYKEEKSSIIGSQNPAFSNSLTWQSINADLSITIRPIVSGDEQITLDITVNQSQFTPREFPDSPPGSVTRQFKSMIRMKNQEMVLLGGLDKIESSSTAKGLPFLARIPIIRNIIGNHSKIKSDSKLSMFIQPTVIY